MGMRGQSYKCAQEKALRTKARRPSAWTKCFSVNPSRQLMKSADCVAGMEHAHCDEVGDDSREGGSDDEEEPAVSLPEFTEAGGLGESPLSTPIGWK
jgi:hypothetical protein